MSGERRTLDSHGHQGKVADNAVVTDHSPTAPRKRSRRPNTHRSLPRNAFVARPLTDRVPTTQSSPDSSPIASRLLSDRISTTKNSDPTEITVMVAQRRPDHLPTACSWPDHIPTTYRLCTRSSITCRSWSRRWSPVSWPWIRRATGAFTWSSWRSSPVFPSVWPRTRFTTNSCRFSSGYSPQTWVHCDLIDKVKGDIQGLKLGWPTSWSTVGDCPIRLQD